MHSNFFHWGQTDPQWLTKGAQGPQARPAWPWRLLQVSMEAELRCGKRRGNGVLSDPWLTRALRCGQLGRRRGRRRVIWAGGGQNLQRNGDRGGYSQGSGSIPAGEKKRRRWRSCWVPQRSSGLRRTARGGDGHGSAARCLRGHARKRSRGGREHAHEREERIREREASPGEAPRRPGQAGGGGAGSPASSTQVLAVSTNKTANLQEAP
jgi:hypothetical protein